MTVRPGLARVYELAASMMFSLCFFRGLRDNEADVSTAQQKEKEQTRISPKDEDAFREESAQPSQSEGTVQSYPMTSRGERRLRASELIRDGKTFDLIRREGEFIDCRFFRTCYLVRGKGGARAGFVVPRRVGTPAQRNRVKRLLRESFRNLRSRISQGALLVFVARPGSSTAEYWEIERQMLRVLRQSGLVG